MTEQVHIRVGDDRHSDWTQHAKDAYEDKYGNLSTLIRYAVERQIELDRGDAQPTADASQPSDGTLADVHDVVQDNNSTLDDVTTELRRLREDVQAQGAVGDDVLSDVYAALPETYTSSETGVLEGDALGMSPTEVSEEVGVTEEDAEAALAQLRREFDVRMIMTAEMDAPVYWREED